MANYNIDAIYNGNTSLPGTERIRIDSSGNVGIGTASPIAPLDVQSNTGGTGIIIRGRSDNSTALRFYANNATTQQAYIGADDSNIDFLSVATRPIRFFVNSLIQYQINQLGVFSWYDGAGGTRMTLNSTGLGIGTTSPTRKLHIYSAQSVIALSNTGTGAWSGLQWSVGNGAYTAYSGLLDDTGRYFIDVGSNGDDFTILQNGNVGIGTTSPSTKLQVKGVITAGSVDSVSGSTLLLGQYGDGNLTVLGTEYSSGGPVLAYAVSPSTSAAGAFLSSTGITISRSAYTQDGGTHRWFTGSSQAVAIGSAVSMSEKMRIDSSGNVGIGTTSPSLTSGYVGLNVVNAGYTQIKVQSSASSAGIEFKPSSGNSWELQANNSNQWFVFDRTQDVYRLTIDVNGNVGIGTSSPSAKIELYNGNFKISDGNRIIFGASDPQIYGNSGVLTFRTNSSDRMYLDTNGNLGIGTSSPLEKITFGSSSSIIARSSAIDFNSGYCSRILFNEGGTGYGYLGFYTYQGGTGGGERMRITESGNIGIGTGSPDKKLQVIGSLGKGLNLYEVSINLLQAIGAQAKRFEIARVFIDYNDWNLTGPVEIEVRENYYSDGRYKKYIFSYGYNSSNVGSLWLIEDAGRGANDFKAEVGAAVLISGDIYYVPIYIDVDYYQYVDVLVRTNRTRTTNASSAAGGVIYINESPTGSNISSFSPDEVTYLSLASSKTYLGYSGNVGIGTASPAYKLDVNGDGRFIGNIAIITDASTGDYSLIAHKYAGVTKAFSGYNGGLAIYGGETGIPTRIQAGGQYALTALTNGNIGIGTISPGAKLDVNGEVYVSPNTAGKNTFILSTNASNDARLLMRSDVTTKVDIQANGASYFNGGNVGIGTSSPTANLHILGAVSGVSSNVPLLKLVGQNTNQEGIHITTTGNGSDFYALKIITGGNASAFNVMNSGNVGIGTTTPAAKLHVSGAYPHIILNNPSAGSGASILFQDNGTAAGFIGHQNATNKLQFSSTNASVAHMTIDSNGNVGIGTTGPASKLDVRKSITSDIALAYFVNDHGTDTRSYIYIGSSPGTDWKIGKDLGSVGNSRFFISDHSNNERLTILTNGNVGIGTTSPSQKLEVNGTVLATAFVGPLTGNITGTAASIFGFGNPTTSATGNAIVYRDGSGDIFFRYSFSSYVNSTDDTSTTGLTYIMAKFGDNYHRSASAAKVATFISGQTMDINGSSTSCSGTATTATTANALNTSNSYTVTQLDIAATTPSLYVRNTGTSPSAIRLLAYLGATYIQSGTSTASTSADLVFSSMGAVSEWMRILGSTGNVGIGTASPAYKLDVNGNIHATAFPTSSDIRFKKNITPLENSLEKVKKLQGVKYEWNEFVNSVRDGYKLNVPIIGLIAQDVEKIVPEVIDLWELSEDCKDARSIDYPRLTPLLIEAIKEQQIIIENQNQKIENLISRVSALEAK